MEMGGEKRQRCSLLNPQIIRLGDCMFDFMLLIKHNMESKSTADPGKCHKISSIKTERRDYKVTYDPNEQNEPQRQPAYR